MKKKTKIALIITAALLVSGAGFMKIVNKAPTADVKPVAGNTENDEPKNVTVQISRDTEPQKVYTEIIDEDTGETVAAEVQENVPPQPKPTTPPKPPKAEGSYTNPEAPPEYTKEQTVSEKKPETKKQTTETKKQGQVYVEGFGYVDSGSSTQTVTGSSNGDINKQVGVMD